MAKRNTKGTQTRRAKKLDINTENEQLLNQVEEKQELVEETNSVSDGERQETPETPETLPKEDNIEVKFNVSKEDTKEMMNFTKLTKIPKFQDNAVWVRAIAKVLKHDMSVSWCVLRRTGANSHNIEKIFGRCSAIAKVGTPIPIEVLPYNYGAYFPKDTEGMAKFISEKTGESLEKWLDATPTQLSDKMLELQIITYLNEYEKNKGNQ